jgi:hypothetical protein
MNISKEAKDWISVLLDGSRNGEGCRAFGRASKSYLFFWSSCKKRWITSDIILQQFSESLHIVFEAYYKKENQDFNILFFIYNSRSPKSTYGPIWKYQSYLSPI